MHDVEMLLRWETHPVRSLYLYQDPQARQQLFRPATQRSDLDPGRKWYIETSSYGFIAYTTGIRLTDPTLKQYGIDVLLFAMSQQLPDGSFSEKSDLHHSVAFYYEVIARFLILSKLPDFSADVPEAVIEKFREGLRLGMKWFAAKRSWEDDTWRHRLSRGLARGWGRIATKDVPRRQYWRDHLHHRFLLNAEVILLAERAVGGIGSEDCEAQAHAWLNTAIERQRADGVMTERAGHDTGYQALGITFGVGMLMVGQLAPDVRARLERCMRKAVDWLLTRIAANGDIDASGNTRMRNDGREINRTDGTRKTIKHYEHAFALYGAGLYFSDRRCLEAVERMMEYLGCTSGDEGFAAVMVPGLDVAAEEYADADDDEAEGAA